jgi:glyoxylase-like metal-dependent hydrolase (beta-lactamase superfamily II)
MGIAALPCTASNHQLQHQEIVMKVAILVTGAVNPRGKHVSGVTNPQDSSKGGRRLAMRRFGKLSLWAVIAGVATVVAAPSQTTTVGTYTSTSKTFSTNSQWIAGPMGTVLIDTQFLPQDGLRAAQAAQRATGMPVTHALVLHPNPDKFNGTAALQAQGVQVQTSAQVLSHVPAVHAIRLGWFADEYKPDYPAEAAKPTSFGDRTQSVVWAGVPLTLHVMGPGCSAAHVVAQSGDDVFVGDLVNPDNHAWLELGTIDDWLQRLNEISAMQPKRVFPGRGQPGGP